MTRAWTFSDMTDLSGRVAVVTGANSGLGLETARALACAGAHVVLACRDRVKGVAATDDILKRHPDADLVLIDLDLADLASIRRFVEAFCKTHDRLDLLINNAGVMALPERRTADGFEMQMGTNHLGHFALTGLLLDRLSATPGARIVTLSSVMHKVGRIHLADINWHRRRYRKWPAYGQSKLANLLFAFELQRRLEATDNGIISLAAHPGGASTHLMAAGPEMAGARLRKLGMGLLTAVAAQSAPDGARPTLYAATHPTLVGGEYIGPNGRLLELWGPPIQVRASKRARDPALSRKLWSLSEELTGVRFAL